VFAWLENEGGNVRSRRRRVKPAVVRRATAVAQRKRRAAALLRWPPMSTAPQLLHVDAGLAVALKPAGLLAVPGRGEDGHLNLTAWVQQLLPDALVVHRLDMATSGLLLMARSPTVQRTLGEDFAARRIGKRYEAIVDGLLPPREDWSLIVAPLMADWPRRPLQKIDPSGKPSRTRWRVLRPLPARGASHLELEPLTGRSHQLRVHLLSIGHPILGDALYGNEVLRQRAPRLLLHASGLAFAHPVDGRPLRFLSPPPFA
jgi:tRNA pseudouridine32 synthase/23S rRNA pseudouridine746 synthase